MRLLVLDFDGVVSDSAPEAFAVALRTWRALRPASRLGDAGEEALYRAFLELMPLGNRAEDYATALAALEVGMELPDQSAYDRWRAQQDEDWLQRFHARFYQERQAFAEGDPVGWQRLLPPYPQIVAQLRGAAERWRYAIATSKDRASVRRLLDAYGLGDLFREAQVLDKETGADKAVHVERLAREAGVALPDTTFVDDKVNHLDRVAPLGARCALAAWGYNGPREHALARERGYLVCSADGFGRLLAEDGAA